MGMPGMGFDCQVIFTIFTVISTYGFAPQSQATLLTPIVDGLKIAV